MQRYIFLACLGLILTGCASKDEPSSQITSFETKLCSWEATDPRYNIVDPCTFGTHEVKLGATFGPENDFYQGVPFTFKAIEEGKAKLERPMSLSWGNNKSNFIHIGYEFECLRTSSEIAGVDLCVRMKSGERAEETQAPQKADNEIIIPSEEPIQYIGE